MVPEELDGPAATVPRLLEIGKILTGILAAVVLSILAFQAVMGLVDQGVASGPYGSPLSRVADDGGSTR